MLRTYPEPVPRNVLSSVARGYEPGVSNEGNEPMMDGRVALVTGGGSGLGRAICRTFADAGALVVVADINEDGAAATADQIRTAGGQAEPVGLDITDSAAVADVVGSVFAKHAERFDCLVNNAGTDRGADIPDLSDEQWHAVFDVNVHGPMYAARAFVQGLLEGAAERTRPADLVSVVSISALTVGSGAAAYNSSKAAHLKLTEVLQTEARERNWPLRVTAINPAAMDTPMMEQWGLTPERMMDPADVARLIRTAVELSPELVLQSAVLTPRVEFYPR
jgi:NAD(P)-dependent dehydrogenase (short-subunit alcohol dehydrogenase family)